MLYFLYFCFVLSVVNFGIRTPSRSHTGLRTRDAPAGRGTRTYPRTQIIHLPPSRGTSLDAQASHRIASRRILANEVKQTTAIHVQYLVNQKDAASSAHSSSARVSDLRGVGGNGQSRAQQAAPIDFQPVRRGTSAAANPHRRRRTRRAYRPKLR